MLGFTITIFKNTFSTQLILGDSYFLFSMKWSEKKEMLLCILYNVFQNYLIPLAHKIYREILFRTNERDYVC